jgi:hypothetical protein
MLDPWIVVTGVAAATAAVAALLPARAGSKRTRWAALAALALASVTALASVADPRIWGHDDVMAAIANGSTRVDPRVFSALGVALAVLLSAPALLASLGDRRPRLVSALTPGIVLAVLITAGAAFLGLRAGTVLVTAALGSLGFGLALGLALRARPRTGRDALHAWLATAAALTAVAVTLAAYGARSDPVELKDGASAETLGGTLVYHGETPMPNGRKRLSVSLAGRRLVAALWNDARGVHGLGAGDWLGGPVVVPIGVREQHAPGHPVEWLKSGDTLAIPGGSVRFDGFRIEGRDTIRIFADLTVTRGTVVDRVSPGVIATRHGEEPFAAELAGVGQVAVAAIDADQKRVGLIMPRARETPVSSTAAFLVRRRPTLIVAWVGAVLAIASLAAAIATRSRTDAALE